MDDLDWLARNVDLTNWPQWAQAVGIDKTVPQAVFRMYGRPGLYSRDQVEQRRHILKGRRVTGIDRASDTGDWTAAHRLDLHEEKDERTFQAAAEETVAPDILHAALRHMEDRAATYDKPEGERSMAATVRAFEAVTGHALTEEQGWLMMVLLKLVRSQQGAYRADNYEDAAAYCGLQGEAATQRQEKSYD